MEVGSKFSFLRSANSVLDLYTALGGWMQVVVEKMIIEILVISVDLDPIFDQSAAPSPYMRISPRLSVEHWLRNTWEGTSRNSLVIDSVKLATELLAPKGTFVTMLFEKVEVDKPQASRSASVEIYIVGFKYKAPTKIDPRIVDVKCLFQGGMKMETQHCGRSALQQNLGKKELVDVDNDEYDDTDEEHQWYGKQLQELLDEAYERFVAKQEGSTKQRKCTKQAHSEGDKLLEADDDNNMFHSDRDSDNDGDHQVNPLVVPLLENAQSQEEIATEWFSQDVFMDVDEREDLENDDSEEEM
ncbi:unnamed protein product [Fraxinus pennsylvanica]|uniref:Uncharacterized protein n=1 Tax=Fraxinus pennsylvanica TaxID=56036 RepID=A0AAD1ZR98_9LAMI|nr:unnamed protein product [Fraxinus pennsylvanica]